MRIACVRMHSGRRICRSRTSPQLIALPFLLFRLAACVSAALGVVMRTGLCNKDVAITILLTILGQPQTKQQQQAAVAAAFDASARSIIPSVCAHAHTSLSTSSCRCFLLFLILSPSGYLPGIIYALWIFCTVPTIHRPDCCRDDIV